MRFNGCQARDDWLKIKNSHFKERSTPRKVGEWNELPSWGTVACCAEEERDKAHNVPGQRSHTPQQDLTQCKKLCGSWENVEFIFHPHRKKKDTKINDRFYLNRSWVLTRCIPIALLWLCSWSFLLINSLCTGWGAPHVWKKKVEMNEKTTTFRRKDKPGWSLLAKTSCAAVETWTAAALQFLREAGYHYLHWSVFTFIHGLLPFLSTILRMQQCSLHSWIPWLLSESHYSNRRRRRTCWCPPLSRSNPSGVGPPPGGSVYGSKCTMVLCFCL